MTEKELHKLKRQDFLQLLLTQGQEMAELQTQLKDTTAELEQIRETDERLKEKLNEKDELIEKLKGRLDQKDATINSLQAEMEEERASRRIELDEAGSIAVAALRLNGIFEAAQQAADQYLYNIKLRHEEGTLGATASPKEDAAPAEPSSEMPEAAQEEKPAENMGEVALNKLKAAVKSVDFSNISNFFQRNKPQE